MKVARKVIGREKEDLKSDVTRRDDVTPTVQSHRSSIARNSAFFEDVQTPQHVRNVYAEINFGPGHSISLPPQPAQHAPAKSNVTSPYRSIESRGSVDSGLYSEIGVAPHLSKSSLQMLESVDPEMTLNFVPPASQSSPKLVTSPSASKVVTSQEDLDELYAKPNKQRKDVKKAKKRRKKKNVSDVIDGPPLPARNLSRVLPRPSINPDPSSQKTGSNVSLGGQGDVMGVNMGYASSVTELYATDSRSSINLNQMRSVTDTFV